MATLPKLTKEDIEKAKKILYHHVDCGHLAGITITLNEDARKRKAQFAILGISSKEPIRAGLRAVDASPFKTVFVVDEESGRVLYALTKNEEYVAAAKKRKPKPGPGPGPAPAPTGTYCCRICAFKGGTSCDPLPDGSCICYGGDRGTGGGLDDALETLAP